MPTFPPRPRLPGRTLTLLLALLGAAALARPEDPAVARAAEHARLAVSLAASPRGAAHLHRLRTFLPELEDLSLLQTTYATVLSRGSTHPLTRTEARLLAAELERARGRLPRAAELLAPLGFLTQFYVVGSFDNEGKSGCGTDFGPEAGALSLTAVYPAQGRDLSWRKLSVAPTDGYVDLSSAVSPRKEAVVYALTFLEATEEAKVELGVGTSGAFKLWVNGAQAATADRYNLPRPDQARVAVRLRKGMNRVMLKVCQESGPLGFYLRQERVSGGAVTPALPDALPAVEKGAPPQPEKLPTLTVAMRAVLAAKPNDPELRGELATLLEAQRAFDEREHADTVEAAKAADAAPKSASLQLLAARLQDEDHNLRRKYLEAALQAEPGSPFARLMLAQHESSRGHPERALALLTPLVKEQPGFAAARLELARTHEAMGEWPAAVGVVEEALRELPRVPPVIREAAAVARRLERPQQALERLRVALSLRYDDGNSRRSLAAILADLGRVEESGREQEVLLRLDPFDNGTRLRLAELYAANDKLPAAQKLFAEARALAPDDSDVFEREGRALLQAGRRDEALAAFERSLQLRPQNPALKEALRSLKGDNSSHGVEYVLDVRALAKEADSYAGEDAVYLVDYGYVRVQPSGLASRFNQLGVKVFSQRGVEAFRSMPITYSPNRQEVRVLKARITKPDGSVVDSYGENERNINEPWTGMYYDARAKVLSFPALAAGDVLEVQYRIDDTAQENLLSDYWGDVEHLQGTAPKLRYQFLVDMPQSRPLYWNKAELPAGVKVETSPLPEARTLYRYSLSPVPKIIPEPMMPGWSEVATTLHVSTYKTWDDVGRYYWGLVRDQLLPNEELRKAVETALTGVDKKDELAIVRAIYSFVVTNTRYVALEFGIHGYKPYRVDRVLARRFGDCKDKASLIHAMLKVAGVDSRLVLLRMRQLGTLSPEPASLAAFNHAIVYVPKYQLYLDGTAEFHGARELPSADRFANVLIVEPSGKSSFLTTPEANADDNLTTLSLDVTLKPDGSAVAKGESLVTGQSAPEYRRAYQTVATRRATFEQGWAQTYPGLTVSEVKLNDTTRLDQDVKLTYQLNIPRFAEALPGGLRFHAFGSGRAYTQTFAPLPSRKYDLVMQTPWVNTFSVRYPIPAGYTVQELPADVNEDTPFGTLTMTHKVEGGRLVCEGRFALKVARVKAADYAAFRDFLSRVDQAFGRKVLITGTAGQTAAR